MKRFLVNSLLITAMLLFVYAVETGVTRFYGDQTLAPMLSVFCFVILIVVGTPNLILVSIPFFTAESYLLIMDASPYPLIRSATLTMTGLFAYWIARKNQKLRHRNDEVEMILSKMRDPWILCDRSGNILQLSASVAPIVNKSLKELEGTSFFSTFSAGYAKGEFIQKFLQAADSRIKVDNVGITVATQNTLLMESTFIPVETNSGSGILVFLTKPQPQ